MKQDWGKRGVELTSGRVFVEPNGTVVVYGDAEDDPRGYEGHSCDDRGCPTLDHVLYVFAAAEQGKPNG